MPNGLRASGYLFSLVLIVTLLGCANWPHKNFIEIYGGKVGRNINDSKLMEGGYPKTEVRKVRLPNGNNETEYLMKSPSGECHIFYESEPSSHTIVNWRFSGSEQACSQPP